MPSDYETFFKLETYAVVGHSAKAAFPELTYAALKKSGKTVHAIDPSVEKIDDDPAFDGFEALPGVVEGVVIEVPKEEVKGWLEQIVKAGIENVWLHAGRESPQALAFAQEHNLRLRFGTCAVQYLDDGFPHSLHKLVRKLLGKY